MDAPGGRDKGKELDPAVAGELERAPAPRDSSTAAGHGPGQAPGETREAPRREVQPDPRPAAGETPGRDAAPRRDDVAEDGG
ncbi:MAG: hypothetical protein ACJ79R_20455 [Anaeromyxobacteraceae bacterium]